MGNPVLMFLGLGMLYVIIWRCYINIIILSNILYFNVIMEMWPNK